MLCFLVFGASAFSAVRDPFMPSPRWRCQDEETVTAWRLRGVVGHQQQWMGWLSTPEHAWLAIRVGDVVASSGWRVSYLDQYQVRLVNNQVDPRCPETELERILRAPLR